MEGRSFGLEDIAVLEDADVGPLLAAEAVLGCELDPEPQAATHMVDVMSAETMTLRMTHL